MIPLPIVLPTNRIRVLCVLQSPAGGQRLRARPQSPDAAASSSPTSRSFLQTCLHWEAGQRRKPSDAAHRCSLEACAGTGKTRDQMLHHSVHNHTNNHAKSLNLCLLRAAQEVEVDDFYYGGLYVEDRKHVSRRRQRSRSKPLPRVSIGSCEDAIAASSRVTAFFAYSCHK